MLEWLTETFSNPYVLIVVLTFVPALELRASIPVGIVMLGRENWYIATALAVACNIVLGPVVYFILDKFLHILLKWRLFRGFWERRIVPKQKKIHAKVEKYGVWGLGFFIGIPLPGSGVYSGAMLGYLLGFSQKRFLIATVVGVLMAAAIVTAVVVTGVSTAGLLIKDVPAEAVTQPATGG